MGARQARRTDEGRCRQCGEVIDRPARKDGGRPVYCAGCLAENKKRDEARIAQHRKANAEIRAQLAPFFPEVYK